MAESLDAEHIAWRGRLYKWLSANPRAVAIFLAIGAFPWASMCLLILAALLHALAVPCNR
jgi:hypothetical protein